MLGPLLLILMKNDFAVITKSVNTYLYADDTAVKQKEQNLHQKNEELTKIVNWLKINKLTLNLDKTINIHFNEKITTEIDNIKIGTNDAKKGL